MKKGQEWIAASNTLALRKRTSLRSLGSKEVKRGGMWKIRVGIVTKLKVFRRQHFKTGTKNSSMWDGFRQECGAQSLRHLPDAETKDSKRSGGNVRQEKASVVGHLRRSGKHVVGPDRAGKISGPMTCMQLGKG